MENSLQRTLAYIPLRGRIGHLFPQRTPAPLVAVFYGNARSRSSHKTAPLELLTTHLAKGLQVYTVERMTGLPDPTLLPWRPTSSAGYMQDVD